MSKTPSDVEVRRFLAQIQAANTRWFKISSALIEFGLRNVPEHRESYNPIKWILAEIGCRMSDMQTNRINRRFREDT